MPKDLKRKLIENIAKKYNVSIAETEKAINHQFKFVAKTIKEGKFHSVRLPYFGIFKPNKKQIEKIYGQHNKKDNEGL